LLIAKELRIDIPYGAHRLTANRNLLPLQSLRQNSEGFAHSIKHLASSESPVETLNNSRRYSPELDIRTFFCVSRQRVTVADNRPRKARELFSSPDYLQ
jgi:hypothetical protein